jgi:hypothetical protein
MTSLTTARRERVAERYERGWTMKDNAAEEGVSIATIHKDLRLQDVPSRVNRREVMPCGSVLCRNPECTVAVGMCHVPACDRPTERRGRINCAEHKGRQVGGQIRITCEICGRQAFRYRSVMERNFRVLCGRRECYDEAQRLYPKVGEVTCAREGCEKVFSPTGARAARAYALYCSPECHGLAKALYPYVGERTCERTGCENTFTPTRWKAALGMGRFCSPACHSARNGELDARVCARTGCGQTFIFRPSEGERRYCTPSCWGYDRWRTGRGLRKLAERFGPKKRRVLKLRWAPKPGRPRNDERPEYQEALDRIREEYERTHAVERDLMKATGESKRMVRTALGRPV